MTALRLKQLQSEFCEYVVHGRNQNRLVEQIRSPNRQQSVQRLDVYRRAYFIRLETALARDFPACERIMGRTDFARSAGHYVLVQPSVSPSLRNLGSGFSNWLRDHKYEVIADLADIEWAVMRVFDGPDFVPSDSSAMQAYAPEDWAALRVELAPTLTLFSLTSNADEVWLTKQMNTGLESRAGRSIAISRNEKFQANITILDNDVFAVLLAINKEPSLAAVSEFLAEKEYSAAVPELLAKTLITAFSSGWVVDVRSNNQEQE